MIGDTLDAALVVETDAWSRNHLLPLLYSHGDNSLGGAVQGSLGSSAALVSGTKFGGPLCHTLLVDQ